MTKLPRRLLSCAAVAIALSAPVVARAQALPPVGAVLVVDQHGTPVGMLVPDAQPQTDPMLVQIMAMQQAMMRQMQDGFGATAIDAPGATSGKDAVAAPNGLAPAAAGMTISTFSSSSDGCSRTTVWRQGATDAAPRLVVDRVADRCGAPATQAPVANQDATPE